MAGNDFGGEMRLRLANGDRVVISVNMRVSDSASARAEALTMQGRGAATSSPSATRSATAPRWIASSMNCRPSR